MLIDPLLTMSFYKLLKKTRTRERELIKPFNFELAWLNLTCNHAPPPPGHTRGDLQRPQIPHPGHAESRPFHTPELLIDLI